MICVCLCRFFVYVCSGDLSMFCVCVALLLCMVVLCLKVFFLLAFRFVLFRLCLSGICIDVFFLCGDVCS